MVAVMLYGLKVSEPLSPAQLGFIWFHGSGAVVVGHMVWDVGERLAFYCGLATSIRRTRCLSTSVSFGLDVIGLDVFDAVFWSSCFLTSLERVLAA